LFASPSEQENFGLSLVEAMAAGVPALISPGVNLAPEVKAAEAGWVLDREKHAFARALASILKDPEELRVRGRRGRLFANQFRWRESAAALTALYEKALRQCQGATGG
jgi:glycosyltransferase involved in cell wall biosynthesis